ncbi:hypothetical protein B0H11DRAFT_1932144 [Mycena galericulata]|nr:hypothetical protein B0H11DRAFT_1932144 [Mycena galericulata]
MPQTFRCDLCTSFSNSDCQPRITPERLGYRDRLIVHRRCLGTIRAIQLSYLFNISNPESPKIKTEEIDVKLLQLRCTDLEADKERLEEELAQIWAALTKERNEVARWMDIAKAATGSIQQAMEHLNAAGGVLT